LDKTETIKFIREVVQPMYQNYYEKTFRDKGGMIVAGAWGKLLEPWRYDIAVTALQESYNRQNEKYQPDTKLFSDIARKITREYTDRQHREANRKYNDMARSQALTAESMREVIKKKAEEGCEWCKNYLNTVTATASRISPEAMVNISYGKERCLNCQMLISPESKMYCKEHDFYGCPSCFGIITGDNVIYKCPRCRDRPEEIDEFDRAMQEDDRWEF